MLALAGSKTEPLSFDQPIPGSSRHSTKVDCHVSPDNAASDVYLIHDTGIPVAV